MAIYRGQQQPWLTGDPSLYSPPAAAGAPAPPAGAPPPDPRLQGGPQIPGYNAPLPVTAPLPPSRSAVLGPRPANGPGMAPPTAGPMSWLQALFGGGGQQTPQGMSAFLQRPMGGQNMAGRY